MTTRTSKRESSGEIQLRLFVSGATPRSMRTVAAVRKVCEANLSGRYSLDVIDIYRDPLAARENQIVAIPTLLKMAPVPKRMFIGDLTNTAPLVAGLGLSAAPPAG
jgi:circadian clock protein KaiB